MAMEFTPTSDDSWSKEFRERDKVTAQPGHPIHTFMLENRAAKRILGEIAAILEKVCDTDNKGLIERSGEELKLLLERLSHINLHYVRKENQLFPALERHGVKSPSRVMWALDDDIRDALRTARVELTRADWLEALGTMRYAVKSIAEMIHKEEHILFPMAMETLSDADWQKVKEGEREIGYAWVVPQEGWKPAEPGRPAAEEAGGEPGAATAEGAARHDTTVSLTTGQLTPEQVNLVLIHVPLELTFVDEFDEVRYFSGLKHKIFPRGAGIIGRKVQNCHPARSLDKVQKILDEFRSRSRDTADFWIEMKGRFIFIRYLAVRDEAGVYRGTLEVVQDVTDIRGLTGEKRLLDAD
jgi:hypothetical protein